MESLQESVVTYLARQISKIFVRIWQRPPWPSILPFLGTHPLTDPNIILSTQ